ncbi:hypothetical protein HKX48_002556 [Thoreauomyces humboldtii]|nr:hypothetical protein HKX48_002556 [Thoreauomyces humboldtii]
MIRNWDELPDEWDELERFQEPWTTDGTSAENNADSTPVQNDSALLNQVNEDDTQGSDVPRQEKHRGTVRVADTVKGGSKRAASAPWGLVGAGQIKDMFAPLSLEKLFFQDSTPSPTQDVARRSGGQDGVASSDGPRVASSAEPLPREAMHAVPLRPTETDLSFGISASDILDTSTDLQGPDKVDPCVRRPRSLDEDIEPTPPRLPSAPLQPSRHLQRQSSAEDHIGQRSLSRSQSHAYDLSNVSRLSDTLSTPRGHESLFQADYDTHTRQYLRALVDELQNAPIDGLTRHERIHSGSGRLDPTGGNNSTRYADESWLSGGASVSLPTLVASSFVCVCELITSSVAGACSSGYGC